MPRHTPASLASAVVLAAAAIACSARAANAQQYYAISTVGLSNRATSHGDFNLAEQESSGSSITSTVSNMPFTGLDGNGNTQTMIFSGTDTASADSGGLHLYASVTALNTYNNPANAPYDNGDGTANPNGSPDTLLALGFAGFNDTLQYGGSIQAGYKARYIFHVEGTNSDYGAAADLSFTIAGFPSESFFDFAPGPFVADWATQEYDVSGVTPQQVNVQFSNQAVLDLFNYSDGLNLQSVSNFSDTLTLAGIEVFDANGNPVTGVTITGANGYVYPTVVPEPSALASLIAPLAVLTRRRR
jgi:hypothetical protein